MQHNLSPVLVGEQLEDHQLDTYPIEAVADLDPNTQDKPLADTAWS
jgi:hypothetical protein